MIPILQTLLISIIAGILTYAVSIKLKKVAFLVQL
jgi:hypothetical protein